MKTHHADDETLEYIASLEQRNARLEQNDKRYQWLRDRLAIEDVERLQRECFGYPFDEGESVKTDDAVDAALAKTKE
jgi:hypothetical protein